MVIVQDVPANHVGNRDDPFTSSHDFAVRVDGVGAMHGGHETGTIILRQAAPSHPCHPRGHTRTNMKDVGPEFSKKAPEGTDVAERDHRLSAKIPSHMLGSLCLELIHQTAAPRNHDRPPASLHDGAANFQRPSFHTSRFEGRKHLHDGGGVVTHRGAPGRNVKEFLWRRVWTR